MHQGNCTAHGFCQGLFHVRDLDVGEYKVPILRIGRKSAPERGSLSMRMRFAARDREKNGLPD